MPANPKAIAVQKGHQAQADFEAAVDALETLSRKRARAIAACLRAGCTLKETGAIFNISRTRVRQLKESA
jgi:DNA-directed RNA polymerase sigma subunit (sigma70/sigma32)